MSLADDMRAAADTVHVADVPAGFGLLVDKENPPK